MFRPLPRLLAQGKERATLALQMLNSHFPNERRIAMDALLKANVVSELAPLLKQWGRVPPQARATIAAGLYRGGYQIVERDRSLGIERLPPIHNDASAW